jgi:t-SNARE complex subunit (syntaxin)
MPATILSPSDALSARMKSVIRACAESSILFNAKSEGKLFVAYERSYDQLIPLLYPWKYESMLHHYNVKLDGTGGDDYIYEQIRYKSYADTIKFVKTETEKLKLPNRDNVLEVMDYDKRNKICSRHIRALAQLEKILTDGNIYDKSELEQRAVIRDIDKDKFVTDKKELADFIYLTQKQSYKSDLLIFNQFVPIIRDIMESIVNKRKKIWGTQYRTTDSINNVYIYVTEFITYAEVAEVELFNQSCATIKFHLISENIIDYWNYLPLFNIDVSQSADSYLKVNRPSGKTHIKHSGKSHSQIELNIKRLKDTDTLKLSDSSDSSDSERKLIDETTILIATEYTRLKALKPVNPIEVNDQKIKLIELNDLSTQFKNIRTIRHTLHAPKPKLIEDDNTESQSHALLLTELSTDHEKILNAREKQIKQIVDGVRDLNQTFIDLKLLVESQGIMIDQIEMNILKTSDFVSHGVLELEKAQSESKTGKKLMTTIASSLGAIAGVLGLGFGIKAAI